MKKKTTARNKKSPTGLRPAGLNNSTMVNTYPNFDKTSITPDWHMVNQFLDALTGATSGKVTFQVFHDRDKQNIQHAAHRHLNRSSKYQSLYSKQQSGCGVFVMVNEGDGNGRKAQNVIKVRALFVDLDGVTWQPAAEALKPHIIVESSPGRFHLYWKVRDCPLHQFKILQKAIATKFHGDKSCIDLSRVLRVPGFFHLKQNPVMSRLHQINDMPEYSLESVVSSMKLDEISILSNDTGIGLPPQKHDETGPQPEIVTVENEFISNLADWAAQNPAFDLVSAVLPEFRIGSLTNGKQHIRCPFEKEHSAPEADQATFIANAAPPLYKSFTIHCMHDHCSGRDRLDFLKAMIEQNWLSPSSFTRDNRIKAKKHPKKFYLPIHEIAGLHEWSVLKKDEFRIALHLTFLMWQQPSGTLPNDDWKIARLLGISVSEWQEYKYNLQMAGWLIVTQDQLTNATVRQEFENAQTALMNAIKNGQKGGDAKAKNKGGNSTRLT